MQNKSQKDLIVIDISMAKMVNRRRKMLYLKKVKKNIQIKDFNKGLLVWNSNCSKLNTMLMY